MTFFNKKTEVMQIELTPYGRYLYSIGKFMPHSYEFVDDDIIYRISGSGEAQESAHVRVINETPKLKINRAFQEEAPMVESPPRITNQRVMVKKNDQKQPNLFPLGRSSYSSNGLPQMQVTMLRGLISGSQMSFSVFGGRQGFHSQTATGGEVLIPQIDVQFNFIASLRNQLNRRSRPQSNEVIRSSTLSNGKYVELSYTPPIIHLKEFNSFYEKENFDIEVFKVSGSHAVGNETLIPLTIAGGATNIVNGMLVDNPSSDETESQFVLNSQDIFLETESEFFFDIETDNEILNEILCQAINSLEINSQFLDEELICPDQRTDQFDIYSTRVTPDDLEDCD